MSLRPGSWLVGSIVVAWAVAACGGTAELPGKDDDGNAGNGGNSGRPGGGTGNVIIIPEGGSGGDDGVGGGVGGPECTPACGLGQTCTADPTGGDPSCVDNTCDDLTCSDVEECVAAPGGGFYCKSIECDSDVDCPVARFCDGEKCVDDVCEAETRRCDGQEVLVCASNGGAEDTPYSCGSAGYFDSECNSGDPTTTGCTCEGDWDCPEYTVCEAGLCKGTGVAPTCTLPPVPFEEVLPELEFRWGGTSAASPNATGKAFAWSSQVGSTPIVVNLDDDNGDGRVNELDFPEIVFMSYAGDSPHQDGIVRAVHAGGPSKGEDYFALCGTTHWLEGEPVISDCAPGGDAESRGSALARSAGALAAGDLDGDGFPEIVVPIEGGGIQILNNRGEVVTTRAFTGIAADDWRYPAPAIANIDFTGPAEIVVGNRVVTLSVSAGAITVDKVFTGLFRNGTMRHGDDQQHHGPTVCLADLTDEFPGLELVAGTSAYRLDPSTCSPASSAACELRLLWDADAVNAGSTFYTEGFCAVADVLGEDTVAAPGPDNELDGVPEVMVIADGRLVILEAATGTLLRNLALNGGIQGGAPNVDDFDGDGFPEIATALENFYTVIDLQDPVPGSCPAWNTLLGATQPPPGGNPARDPGGSCTSDADCNAGAVCNERVGTCVCLHSGWRRDTEDDSSRVTSSSVFDFNGDGAAEVVYNDECYFRLYDGASGGLYLALPSLSRTIIENPVVSDVDNDGNAEIVFVQNNETRQCGETNLDSWPDGNNDVVRESLPNGIEVWGDPSDVWVAARRVWNQHSYHVTNVTEGGAIPQHEPESWRPLNGRLYNTYRSQPRNYGVAPDLALVAIQVSSPDVMCGELSDSIEISVLVKNQGDLRVGPGVVLEFFGAFEDPALSAALEDDMGNPLAVTLDKSLEPGASTIVTVVYEAGRNGRDDLPVEVRAVIDGADTERECNEDNNEIAGPVESGADLPDLRLELDRVAGCSPPRVTFTVYNDGTLPAEGILVRFYAGDPSQGGKIIGETTLDGPIGPGESESATLSLEPQSLDVVVYAVVDPLDAVVECNDANNLVRGPRLDCGIIAR